MVPTIGLFSEIITPTPAQKAKYLELVANGRSLHGAAKDIGVPVMSMARERQADEAFGNDLQIALAMRGGAMLEIALEQCTVGIDKALTYQGHVMYEYPEGYELDENGNAKPGVQRVPVTVKELVTNNAMLLKLLAVTYPERFKDRSEVDVRGGTRTRDTVPDRITNDGDREKLIALLDKRARVRAPITDVDADPDEDLL
jgi:hypothetical protein